MVKRSTTKRIAQSLYMLNVFFFKSAVKSSISSTQCSPLDAKSTSRGTVNHMPRYQRSPSFITGASPRENFCLPTICYYFTLSIAIHFVPNAKINIIVFRMVQVKQSSSYPSLRRRKKVGQHVSLTPGAFVGVLVASVVIFLASYYRIFHRQNQTDGVDLSVDALHVYHHQRRIGASSRQKLRSSSKNQDSMMSWCRLSLDECVTRLEILQSKLELEEQIYQEQYEAEKDRSQDENYYPHYTQTDIARQRLDEILEDSSHKEHHFPLDDELKGVSPELNVIGNLKTGTSQLYNIFATHKEVAAIQGDDKEHCPSDHYGEKETNEASYEFALYAWHKYYVDNRVSGKRQVNGCVSIADFERRVAYNPPPNTAKFFVLLRDPADWAWAAYNFWCDESWEEFDDDNWVDASIHYRSPEIFHEVILSGGKLKAFALISELRENSIHLLRQAQALVGKDNLIVLRNEDLVPRRIHESGLLQRLVDVTGLSMEGFDENVLKSRSNCNAKKGYDELCADTDRTSNLQGIGGNGVGYPVTHNRPMLESTRRFIYLQWHKECKIWAEEFGIEYPECLASIPEDSHQLPQHALKV